MKWKLIFILGLILLINVSTKLKQTPRWNANIADLRQEVLAQNEAKYIIGNNLAQTQIDVNPERYNILSPKDLQRGEVNEKDKSAYYPNAGQQQQPILTNGVPLGPPSFAPPQGSVYPYDPKPYYGQGLIRVVNRKPSDGVAVPVAMADLTYTFASNENVRKLENELRSLVKKSSINEISEKQLYAKDAGAYYDPTLFEHSGRALFLIDTITRMKAELANPMLPKFEEERIKRELEVQNFQNLQKENTNERIAESIWYGVGKDKNGYSVPVDKKDGFSKVETVKRIEGSENKYGNDNKVTKAEPEVIEGVLPDKYVNEEKKEVSLRTADTETETEAEAERKKSPQIENVKETTENINKKKEEEKKIVKKENNEENNNYEKLIHNTNPNNAVGNMEEKKAETKVTEKETTPQVNIKPEPIIANTKVKSEKAKNNEPKKNFKADLNLNKEERERLKKAELLQ